MPLLNYTTKVDIFTTIGQIQGQLVRHGARSIVQDYDESGNIIAIAFMINTPFGLRSIRLPANVSAVQRVLERQKVKTDREQAERVAWRDIKDWVEAQMALLETEMVSIDEIFLPYMIGDNGKTVYQIVTNNQLRIEGATEREGKSCDEM